MRFLLLSTGAEPGGGGATDGAGPRRASLGLGLGLDTAWQSSWL